MMMLLIVIIDFSLKTKHEQVEVSKFHQLQAEVLVTFDASSDRGI